MKKIIFASAFALAALGPLSDIPAASASEYANFEQAQMPAAIDIARVKNVLKLTREQELYWPPVEAALRDIARRQASSEPAGFVRRISHRVVSIVLNSVAVERLAVAARPLLAVLDNAQKQAASGLAREMGLGPVVMAALK
jgi:hypothetical protein